MGHDITGLHHVGHLVHDMAEAVDRYRRLGFTLAPPGYPVLPGSSRPAGVANAHAYFSHGFLELVALAAESRMPAGARPIPMHVPADRLPAITAAIEATTAGLAASLRRFQGMHILMLDSADLDATVARLAASGVGHGAVHTVQRPIETPQGTRTAPARFLELADVPEGRVGMAENLDNAPTVERAGPRHSPVGPGVHANGAVGLAGAVLCVPDDQIGEVERRYARYLGEPDGAAKRRYARSPDGPDGAAERRYARSPGEPDRAVVSVVGASAVPGLFPGERPPGVPGFAVYMVEVTDLAAAERLLRAEGVPLGRSAGGEPFVPAAEALGVTIVFRQSR